MYFSNATYRPIVDRYRVQLTALELAKTNRDHLTATADQRRRLRADDRDEQLERSRSHVATIEKELRDLRERLAEGVYLIARNAAKKYKPSGDGLDRDDCIQLAVIYTMERVHKFDPNQGTSLLCWITHCIRNTWMPLMRKKHTAAVAFERFADVERGRLEREQAQTHCPSLDVELADMTTESDLLVGSL